MRCNPFAKLSFLFLLALLFPFSALAGTGHNLVGWAWSDTIGWISFNSTNDHDYAQPGIQESPVNYGVHMRSSDGSFCGNETCSVPGYAWSSNIGWIQFGGLSGFPNGSGTQGINAKLNGNNLQGWARALNPDGGWDGWIALSGAGPSYGVVRSGNNFTGYTWGSMVVGWLSFDAAGPNGVRLSNSVSWDVRAGGAEGTSMLGQVVPYNTVPTFVTTFVNVPSISCDLTKTSAGGVDLNPPLGSIQDIVSPGGSFTDAPLAHTPPNATMNYAYKLTCTNPSIEIPGSFTVAAQPAGFTLGGNDTAKIQFLESGESQSEVKNIFVSAVGGYSNPVTISISTYPVPPAGTTFTYSLGGSAFSANPAPVVISSPYNAGTTFQVKISKKITAPYDIIFRGSGAGTGPAYKTIRINPTAYDPNYREF